MGGCFLKLMKYPIHILIGLLLVASGFATPPSGTAANTRDVPPKAVCLVPPKYPFELHKAGLTGEALIEFVVSASGEVTEARVISATHPLFGAAAVNAVLKSKFTAALRSGKPVNTRMRMPMFFNLNDQEVINEIPEAAEGNAPMPHR